MTANLDAASISAAELSLDNGGTFVPVSELTAEQIKLALDLIAARGDETCREAAHNSLEGDDERAFLAAYCAAHEQIYDERVLFG